MLFDNRVAIQILAPQGELPNNILPKYSILQDQGLFSMLNPFIVEGGIKGQTSCEMWMVPVGILITTTSASLLLLFVMCHWNSQKKKELAKLGIPPTFNGQVPVTGNFRQL